jgi:hypothetical protein
MSVQVRGIAGFLERFLRSAIHMAEGYKTAVDPTAVPDSFRHLHTL